MNSRQIRSPGYACSGFTLIEMLVVIAIIALLVSLIFPGVGRTLERAEMMRCQSNQRQIVSAILAYASQHQGELPLFEAIQSQVGYRDFWAGALIREGFLDAAVADHREDLPGNSIFRCPSGLSDQPAGFPPPSDSIWTTDPDAHRPYPGPFDDQDGTLRFVHVWYGLNARTEASFGSNQGWPFIRSGNANQRTTLMQVNQLSRTVVTFDGVWSHNSIANRIYARHGTPRKDNVMSFFDGSVRTFEARSFALSDNSERDLSPRFRIYKP